MRWPGFRERSPETERAEALMRETVDAITRDFMAAREEKLRAFLRALPWPDRGRVVVEVRPNPNDPWDGFETYRVRSWGEIRWSEYQSTMQALWRHRALLDAPE